MLRAVVLTQYRRVTDRRTNGQTVGIAMANAVHAMRALWHAVKIVKSPLLANGSTFRCKI